VRHDAASKRARPVDRRRAGLPTLYQLARICTCVATLTKRQSGRLNCTLCAAGDFDDPPPWEDPLDRRMFVVMVNGAAKARTLTYWLPPGKPEGGSSVLFSNLCKRVGIE